MADTPAPDWHVQYRKHEVDHVAWYAAPEDAIEAACALIDESCDVYGIGSGSLDELDSERSDRQNLCPLVEGEGPTSLAVSQNFRFLRHSRASKANAFEAAGETSPCSIHEPMICAGRRRETADLLQRLISCDGRRLSFGAGFRRRDHSWERRPWPRGRLRRSSHPFFSKEASSPLIFTRQSKPPRTKHD